MKKNDMLEQVGLFFSKINGIRDNVEVEYFMRQLSKIFFSISFLLLVILVMIYCYNQNSHGSMNAVLLCVSCITFYVMVALFILGLLPFLAYSDSVNIKKWSFIRKVVSREYLELRAFASATENVEDMITNWIHFMANQLTKEIVKDGYLVHGHRPSIDLRQKEINHLAQAFAVPLDWRHKIEQEVWYQSPKKI